MTAVVLDITRSVLRVAKSRLTGIDRVELAYIDHFLQSPDPVVFLAHISGRSYLLDRVGMDELRNRIEGHGPWDFPLLRRGSRRAAVLATLRRLSIRGRCEQILRRIMPAGFTYLHVGHADLPMPVQQTLRRADVGKVAVLVHDTIPLDFPQYCGDGTRESYEKRLRAYLDFADIILCNSTHTAQSVQKRAREWGVPVPDTAVLFLGVDPLPVGAAPAPEHPYFVTLGTIEPRKNHRLLLDIWQDFATRLPEQDTPHLYIIGARGWLNEDVFQTLDTAPFMGKTVFETGRLPDADVATLLHGATALLFPSFAEGFGYPLLEALQLKTPVICSDLPSFHELAGDIPLYLNPMDRKSWQDSIRSMTGKRIIHEMPDIQIPDWETHFHNLATILS